MSNCQIHSLGSYVPDDIITNDYLESIVDTNNQWIVERTGIIKRHKIKEEENASTLGLRASLLAIETSTINSSEITHVIAATCTPDHLSPSVACIISGQLNLGPVMAFDISAACTGFIYGISVCRSFLLSDPDAVILFVCTEALTRRLNWRDRGTCVLFGDAATASIMTSKKPKSLFEVKDVLCQSDGKQKDLIIIGGGTACKYSYHQPVDESFFLSMQGRDTYKHAVRQMVNVCEQILKRNNLTVNDIDLFIPHQANMRIIEAVGNRLHISMNKVFTNVANYGNTSAASIPLAINEALSLGVIKSHAKVLITAFGAGLTWGAALLDF